MTRDEWLDLATLVMLLTTIFMLAWIVRYFDRRHDEHKQDVAHMRARLERHDEDAVERHEAEAKELKKMRLGIFRHFEEWLREMRK